jgi:CubicO group peptidase (beta-lactamase class C family)
MKEILFVIFSLLFFTSCKKSPVEPIPDHHHDSYYFPELTGDIWEQQTPESLGWDKNKLNEAFDYAGTKNTYGLIILHNGKIVKEQYWNNWTKDTRYFIASAGKSVIGFLVGIAQQDGIVNINDKTSKYLGTGWTSLSADKEDLITVKHNLSMTTGLDDDVADDNCKDPACLIYKADAGTRWAYHNAPYRLLHDVLSNASGLTLQAYSKQKLFDMIGMNNSSWINSVMWCTTRDAARFGSLILNKGVWNGTSLLSDISYFNAMTNSSQDLNKAYGYLFWLNGKSSFMAPTLQTVFSGSLAPSAPSDMLLALGKDDKKIYIVPSLNVVVVRLGDASGASLLGPSGFDNEFWQKLKPALKY